MQKLRSTVIEGIFGQAKVLHGMDRSKFRGLKKVEIQFLMTACALNLKKMVKMMDIDRLESIISENIFNIIQIGKSVLRELIKELSAVVALATVPFYYTPGYTGRIIPTSSS